MKQTVETVYHNYVYSTNVKNSKGKNIEQSIEIFKQIVWHTYETQTRIKMPWREKHTPYAVLLSEIMLQQTQVVRVIDYFNAFIIRWSTVCALSHASLKEVLSAWSGLGYYRRAKYLHECARIVCKNYNGIIPADKNTLHSLPGIGDYTSSAIIVFAYNKPTVLIETNIRRAIIYHFFPAENNVSEQQVRNYVELTMDLKNPRKWYWALMDYGAHLAFKVKNPNRRSAVYTEQSHFKGSNRQVRAAILHVLLKEDGLPVEAIADKVAQYIHGQHQEKLDDTQMYHTHTRVYKNIEKLTNEKFMVCENGEYFLLNT